MREFRRFCDDRHAGAVLWPHLPQIGRVFPQGAGGFVGEDGGGRGLALREVAEGDAVAQTFVEDVLLSFGDQPRGHFVVVNRRAKQRLVVGEPDVAVDRPRHFQQRSVKARNRALELVGEVLQHAVKDARRFDYVRGKTSVDFGSERSGEGVMRRRLRAVEDAKLYQLVVVQLAQVCAELGGNRRFLFRCHHGFTVRQGRGCAAFSVARRSFLFRRRVPALRR